MIHNNKAQTQEKSLLTGQVFEFRKDQIGLVQDCLATEICRTCAGPPVPSV